MKAINYMNFVRQSEPRYSDWQEAEKRLFDTTARQLEIAKKYDIPCTFLLEYDALIDEKYIELFKNNSYEKTEIGLWYELPRQLLDAVGLPWRGKEGWNWDWHIIPGFSMAYTQQERKILADAAMEKFKEVFGSYPKSVASWLIDSYTIDYMSEKYDVDYFAICRDQINTDAYTLVGGYFNGGYYPSKKNMFTPAQTKENMVKTPVFRLLGPDPVHNYDNEKYILSDGDRAVLYTLEPAWTSARRKDVVEWYDRTYYKNESLSFSCVQIGQENSFFEVGEEMLKALEMQIEVFKSDPEVKFMTTGEMGKRFRDSFDVTPPECVFASEDWSAGEKVQSLYYNCKNYMANLFRFEDRIFFRSIYLFDENVEEKYLSDPCETAYVAIYENLPVCDTVNWKDNSGFELDKNACKFDVKKNDDGSLTAFWNDKSVTFTQEKIVLKNVSPVLDVALSNAEISASDNVLEYKKDGAEYSVKVIGAQITLDENTVAFTSGENVELAFC